MAHLRQNRTQLREEWARRITESRLLTAMTREEIFVATAGVARVTVDGVSSELRAGDALVVPGGVQFALANDGAEQFEAVVAFPVGGQAVTADGTFTPPWAL